jgi:hypothetical protein
MLRNKWREQFLSSKWLNINEDVAYKRKMNCTSVVELRNTGKYLYKIVCKWENKTELQESLSL